MHDLADLHGLLAHMQAAWAEAWRVLCPGGRIAVIMPMGYGRPSTGSYLPIGDDTPRRLQAAGFTLRPGNGLGELAERRQPERARLP